MKTRKNTLMTFAFLTLFISVSSNASEAAHGQNFMVLDNQAWPTGEKSGFYLFNGQGISNITIGPTETSAISCHGSGYWGPEGSRSEGICVHGAEENTFTSSYQLQIGEESGEWKILWGTGKYTNISGQGTYKPNQLPGNRAISTWEGEISLGE